MSATAQRLAVEAAQRRVLENLRSTSPERPSSTRRAAVLAIATALFAATFAARLAIDDPPALIANFYVVPIAMIAIEFGARAGVLAALVGMGLVFAWNAIATVHTDALGYTSRGAALLITGALVGRFSERLRDDVAERKRAERSLSLYADELERANQHLAQTVARLEAFAHIARVVGGETELDRVLGLILAGGREIVGAKRLLVCLPDGADLVAVSGSEAADAAPRQRLRFPIAGSLAGEVLTTRHPQRVTADNHSAQLSALAPGARTAMLVPLVFRGETLGVLAAIDRDPEGDRFGAEQEQLLVSVAASAATALATARSVAAQRLRLSLDAAEQARARWARELHDETLQGLTGVRMVLAAGLARADCAQLRDAAETADRHLAAEMRSLRELIAELRPAALDDLGLGPAIESLAQRQAAAGGFAVDVDVDLRRTERPRELESAAYRIVQEALSNVVKHAAAERVIVRVHEHEDKLELTVTDDGRGFAPASARESDGEGFGLAGMRERAVLLGGQLSVDSRPGGPTSVTAALPSRPSTT